MIIEIIRHGETALQAEKKYQGRTDAPLSSLGRSNLLPAEQHPEQVYVSPLLRARETASILFPEAKQIVIPAFSEMDFGVFEGRSAAEMENDAQYRAWVDSMCEDPCPGGESKADFSERVCNAFDVLLNNAGCTLPESEKRLVIVAHGGIAMALLERFAEEKRPFYEWYLQSGCGYLLEADEWQINKVLRVLGKSVYTRRSAL